MRYDPTAAPDGLSWLQADEGERLEAVFHQHERAREVAGNLRLHAAIHVTVETQLAEGHGAIVRTMQRLLAQSLDRHDALHAIGSVVAEQMLAVLKGRSFDAADYETRLDALSATSWRDGLRKG